MTTVEIRLSQAMDTLRENRGVIPQCVGVVPTANAREYRMTFAKPVSQHHMTNMKEALPGCVFLIPAECSDPSKACVVLARVPKEWVSKQAQPEPIEQTEEQPAPISVSEPEITDLVTGEPANETTTHVKIAPAAKTVEQRIKEAFAGAHGGKAKDISKIERLSGVSLPNEYRLTSRVSINKDAQFAAHGLDRVLFASVYTMTFTVPDAWVDMPSGTPVPEALDSAEEVALTSFYALATTNINQFWTTTFACAPERATEHLETRGMLDKSQDMAHGNMYRINAKGADAIGKPYPPEVANSPAHGLEEEIKTLKEQLAFERGRVTGFQGRIHQLQYDLEASQRLVDDLTTKDARITDPGWTFVRVEDWNRDQEQIALLRRIDAIQGRMLAERVEHGIAMESRAVTTPVSLNGAKGGAPMLEVDRMREEGWRIRSEHVTPPQKAGGDAHLITVMERRKVAVDPGSAEEQAARVIDAMDAAIQPEIDAARDALAGVIRWHNNAPAPVPVLASGQVQS